MMGYWRHTWEAAWRGLSRFEAGMLAFWLAGPFVYLIERSPADVWLSLIGLVFVGRCVAKNDWGWVRLAWVRAVAVFFVVASVMAVFSPLWGMAIVEPLIWLRFPLFAVACVWWLGSDSARVRLMLLAMGAAAVIMTGFLLVEVADNVANLSPTDGSYAHRLEGPYGDLVPGMFMGKAMLPLAVVAAVLAMRSKIGIKGIAIAGIAFVLVVMTLLTGERVNSAVIGIAVIIAAILAISDIKAWRRLGFYVVLGLAGLGILFVFDSGVIRDHVIGNTLGSIGGYFPHFVYPGVALAWENPLTGIGAGMYRHLCDPVLALPYGFAEGAVCLNHPHQFYVQLAAETGIFGLVAGVIMIILLIRACYTPQPTSTKLGWLAGIRAWIIPLVIFFPQTNADFFAQWHNLFIWLAIGLALALARAQAQASGKK